MNKTWLLFLLFPITVSVAFADYPIALNIPPTNAFDKIESGSSKISAVNYSMPLIITGSGSVVVTLNNSTHTISIIGSGGATGIISLNGNMSAAQTIQGIGRNVTVTDNGNIHTINTGDAIANLISTQNQTFAGKVNFTGTSKLAPINLSGISADPTNLKNFDMWINSGNTLLRYRASTTTITVAQ